MANYLTEEKALEHAQRLGINVEGMTWQEINSVVSKALKEEKKFKANEELINLRKENERLKKQNQHYHDKYDIDPMKNVPSKKDYENNKVMIAPPIPRGKGPAAKLSLMNYEEELNNDVDYDEVSYVKQGLENFPKDGSNVEQKADYNIKNYKHEKVYGVNSIPRGQQGVFWDFDKDPLPRLYDDEGRPLDYYVKADFIKLIKRIRGGMYLKMYKDDIKEGTAACGGNRIGISIETVHDIMSKIIDNQAYDKERGRIR